jgi:glycerol-3-phosphate acyltransferase PlsY
MITAYLIGSINPAIIFSKAIYHEDIRSYGSGNAGTTNTLRTYGKKMAILIFALDLFKAALAIALGSFLLTRNIGGAVSALFVVLGHMFPIYYKFKGGKGVACAAMCILLLSPITFLILLTLFIVIVACFRYISLGSVMCAMLFPFLNYIFYPLNGWITLSAFCIGALIVFMHRENIKRLMEGKESKLSFKKTDKHAAAAHNGGSDSMSDIKVEAPEKEYRDEDFVKCECGRIIPKTREKCAYCGAVNKKYVPNDDQDGKK